MVTVALEEDTIILKVRQAILGVTTPEVTTQWELLVGKVVDTTLLEEEAAPCVPTTHPVTAPRRIAHPVMEAVN